MKANIKRILCYAAACIMVLSLMACTAKPAATEETATEPSATTEPAATTDAAAPATDDKVVIGISQCQSSDPWRIAQVNSLKAEAEKYPNFEIIYTDAQGDTAQQISDVEDIIAQGVDYLVLIPREFEASAPALAIAKEAGVPVVVIDRSVNGVAGVDYITYIGTDFVQEAKMVGEWLAKFTEGKANIVEITGTAGSAAAIDRQKGFMEVINQYPDMKVIVSQTADFSRSEAQKVMENIIQSRPGEFNVVFAHNDEMALGAIQALKGAGLVPGKDVLVLGIDGQSDAVKAIIAGDMSATATCNPHYGPITFETLAKIISGETVPTLIMVQDYLIDSTNAEAELPNAF